MLDLDRRPPPRSKVTAALLQQTVVDRFRPARRDLLGATRSA
jgi:hypothetical protein